MTYTKPEINVLGDATHVIQFLNVKGIPTQQDPDRSAVDPAYDLDE
jgi:hypothetical protein